MIRISTHIMGVVRLVGCYVKELRIKLGLSGIKIRADSRNLRDGDKLWPQVAEAI